jgi:hypothetical protein
VSHHFVLQQLAGSLLGRHLPLYASASHTQQPAAALSHCS